MKRIFYFTGHRFTVIHWSRKAIVGSYSFEPDVAGLDKFEKYLEQTTALPTRLLIDVIEEDFRQETVPHVGKKDRTAVVDRMLDRYYRSSKEFAYYEVIGREKSGRKDDEILLCAMTDPSLILPWLEIIGRTETPLAGIWTLPLVSKRILKSIGATKGPVLLVSQEVNSTLRQTFFRNGKMITSRQSVVNQDANNIRNIGKFASPEIDRTSAFLYNQHLIGDDEELQIHVLCSDEQIESLNAELVSDSTRRFLIHKIDDIGKKIGIRDINSSFADGIYAWLCMTDTFSVGHYGQQKAFRRYYYSLGAAALYVASVLVLVVAAVVTESNISSAIEATRSVDLLKQQETGYRTLYKKKFSTYEEVFKNASSMNSAVDLAHTIERHASVSPLDLYIEVSKILARPEFKNVKINSIKWVMGQRSKKDNKIRKQGKIDIASPDPMVHIAVLSGVIPVSNNDYGGSVNQINEIVQALLNDRRIVEAKALNVPVDVRSDKSFTAESGGVNVKTKDKTGRFSIRIVMKGRDDV